MRPSRQWLSRLAVVVLIGALVVGAVPDLAAAESRAGDTVVVGADERTGDLEAFGGGVVVRGVVDGDLVALGGDVRIPGEVTGNVDSAAGNVQISGRVGGDLRAAGGNVELAEGGVVEGDFEAGGGSVVILGSVGGSAKVGAGTIRLGPGSRIAGDLEYDGQLSRSDGAQVGGAVTANSDLGIGPFMIQGPLPQISAALFSLYFFLVNLAVGALLLLAFPRFSRDLAAHTRETPVVTGVAGVATLVGVPVLLVLLALTILGIPLSLFGIGLYVLALWLGVVYGRYLVGEWLLTLVDRENRWLALVVGFVAVEVLRRVPLIGGLLDFVVLLLGLGALVLAIVRAYRGRRRERTAETSEKSETGGDAGASTA